jgi:hypothetical protein
MPDEVKLILFTPADKLAPKVNAPVLFIVTAPVPFCVITPVVKAEPFVKEITPVPLLVAAKPVTVFAFVNAVPVAELVVSKPPFNKPPVASLIVPAVPVKLIAPLVLMVAPVSVMLLPAVTDNAPEVLEIPALTNTLLVLPVAVRPTVPIPLALTVFATVIVPALVTETLPPPVSEIVFNVNAALFTKAILPLVVLVAVKLAILFAPFNVVPPTEEVVNPLPLIKPPV